MTRFSGASTSKSNSLVSRSNPWVPTGTCTTEIFAGFPVLIFAAPVLAPLGLQGPRERDVEQRRLPLVADEHDVTPLCAVPTRRSAVGHVALAAKSDAPVSAATGDHLDLACVDELHGCRAF